MEAMFMRTSAICASIWVNLSSFPLLPIAVDISLLWLRRAVFGEWLLFGLICNPGLVMMSLSPGMVLLSYSVINWAPYSDSSLGLGILLSELSPMSTSAIDSMADGFLTLDMADKLMLSSSDIADDDLSADRALRLAYLFNLAQTLSGQSLHTEHVFVRLQPAHPTHIGSSPLKW